MPRATVGTKRSFGNSTCASSQDTSATAPSSKNAEVDKEVSGAASYEVVHDDSGAALSCYLMKSCASKNNNKYYILQVLRRLGSDSFYLHTRYGRVGCTASNTQAPMNRDAAIKAYNKTFKQKSGGAKGYTPIVMKMGAADSDETATKLQKLGENAPAPTKYEDSKLSAKVQQLVNFIYDKGLMEQSMASVGYDIKRLPLGALSDETVLAGYKVLRQIEEVLDQRTKGKLD